MNTTRTVVVGVTGSIAAYKACEIVSRLKQLGLAVQVVMTRAATRFVSPLTFQTLSENPVHASMFRAPHQWNVEHVSLAQAADVLLVAPATANFLGKLAGGIADDLLLATVLATRAPVLIAPAMNAQMYENPLVQDNLFRLRALGYEIIEPGVGRLACGAEGTGRLRDIEEIIRRVQAVAEARQTLSGRRVVVVESGAPGYPGCLLSEGKGRMVARRLARRASAKGAGVLLVTQDETAERIRGMEVAVVDSRAAAVRAVLEASADSVVDVSGVAPCAAPGLLGEVKRAGGKFLAVAIRGEGGEARPDGDLGERGADLEFVLGPDRASRPGDDLVTAKLVDRVGTVERLSPTPLDGLFSLILDRMGAILGDGPQ